VCDQPEVGHSAGLAPEVARGTGDLDRAVRVSGILALGFAALVTGIGLLLGLLPVWPTERVSYALGFSAALPVLAAVGAYLGTQAIRLTLDRGYDRDLLPHLRIDAAFLVLFVVVTYFHFNLKMWSPLINPALFDAAYWATDGWVRPLVDASLAVSASVRGFLGDDGFCTFTVSRHRYYGHFVLSVLLVLSLGGLSYLIAPALGPFLFETGASARAAEAQASMQAAFAQAQARGAEWIAERGGDYFTGALAAMPSLHFAHALVMTYWMLASRSLMAGFFVLMTAWIAVDAVGLRWHYVVDLPAGALLAAVVVVLTRRLLDRPVAPQVPQPAVD
jgi:hypothetical protein